MGDATGQCASDSTGSVVAWGVEGDTASRGTHDCLVVEVREDCDWRRALGLVREPGSGVSRALTTHKSVTTCLTFPKEEFG
jgi:hypothetical protein